MRPCSGRATIEKKVLRQGISAAANDCFSPPGLSREGTFSKGFSPLSSAQNLHLRKQIVFFNLFEIVFTPREKCNIIFMFD